MYKNKWQNIHTKFDRVVNTNDYLSSKEYTCKQDRHECKLNINMKVSVIADIVTLK